MFLKVVYNVVMGKIEIIELLRDLADNRDLLERAGGERYTQCFQEKVRENIADILIELFTNPQKNGKQERRYF